MCVSVLGALTVMCLHNWTCNICVSARGDMCVCVGVGVLACDHTCARACRSVRACAVSIRVHTPAHTHMHGHAPPHPHAPASRKSQKHLSYSLPGKEKKDGQSDSRLLRNLIQYCGEPQGELKHWNLRSRIVNEQFDWNCNARSRIVNDTATKYYFFRNMRWHGEAAALS